MKSPLLPSLKLKISTLPSTVPSATVLVALLILEQLNLENLSRLILW